MKKKKGKLVQPVEKKPQVNLDSINEMLRNSFGAIKMDMLHLKEAQEEQIRDIALMKKELKEFKQGCATKDDLQKMRSMISAFEINQKALTSKLKELDKYSHEIVVAVNERIKELNTEFDKILKIKDNLQFKLKTFDRLEDDFKDFKKTKVDKTQLKKVIEDTNKELDKMEDGLVSKKDLLKLAKRVEKLEAQAKAKKK